MASESLCKCFAYITLPGQTEAVTVGSLEVTNDRSGSSLGRFVYGKSYLTRPDAVPIAPVELPLSQDTFETTQPGGIFGPLRDASPDYWGRRVLEGIADTSKLDEMEYLLHSNDDRAGALTFGLEPEPTAACRDFNNVTRLTRLLEIASGFMRERDVQAKRATPVNELRLIRTSMGGARPKCVVEDTEGLWVAKFNRPDDRWNNVRIEKAMLELAKTCGIDVASSRVERVAGGDVLLVKRFDRGKADDRGYTRARMISGLTLLRADESVAARERWSYLLLSEEMRRVVGAPAKDAKELFRRMTFNALISNIDDHPRNHALIAENSVWRLSPAYDLTPTPQASKDARYLAMQVGDKGRYANARNLVSQCPRFSLGRDEAHAIVEEMTGRVRATWHGVLRAQGVSEKDAGIVKDAFVYDGFFH